MFETLHIRKLASGLTPGAPPAFMLCLRHYDGTEVNWTRMARLDLEAALAISGDHTGINMEDATAWAEIAGQSVSKALIDIRRVADRAPRTRAWVLHIHDRQIAHIADDTVLSLARLATPGSVVFEQGQPDWKSREAEDIADKIADMQEEIAALNLRRQKLLDDSAFEQQQLAKNGAQPASGPAAEKDAAFEPSERDEPSFKPSPYDP